MGKCEQDDSPSVVTAPVTETSMLSGAVRFEDQPPRLIVALNDTVVEPIRDGRKTKPAEASPTLSARTNANGAIAWNAEVFHSSIQHPTTGEGAPSIPEYFLDLPVPTEEESADVAKLLLAEADAPTSPDGAQEAIA